MGSEFTNQHGGLDYDKAPAGISKIYWVYEELLDKYFISLIILQYDRGNSWTALDDGKIFCHYCVCNYNISLFYFILVTLFRH